MKPDDLKTPDRLRDALRRGDPALGESGLRLDEVQRMRRAVLTAEPEPRRWAFPGPVWAAAAAAGIAASLLLALGLWRLQGPTPDVRSPEPPPVPAASAPVLPPPALAPATPERAERRAESRKAGLRPSKSPERSPAPPVPPAEEPDVPLTVQAEAETEPFLAPNPMLGDEDGVEETRPRQVQLVAPGGTRVLWMLHSEPISTHEAAPVRPEEKTE